MKAYHWSCLLRVGGPLDQRGSTGAISQLRAALSAGASRLRSRVASSLFAVTLSQPCARVFLDRPQEILCVNGWDSDQDPGVYRCVVGLRPISSARDISRLSSDLESTLSTLLMSDQILCWARGGAVKYCMTDRDPGTPSRCEHRCEYLRHRPNLMSDRTWGAWNACSLDGVTAWKRPEPTHDVGKPAVQAR